MPSSTVVRGALALAVALGVWCGESSSANACSPPWGAARVVLPPDGATGVPLNAEIVVEYEGGVEFHDWQLQVRPQGGEPLALEVETTGASVRAVLEARLAAPLEANTTYEVLDQLTTPCDDWVPNCLRDDFAVIASFTTGTAPDLAAPQFAGIEGLSSGFVPEDQLNSCGSHSYVSFQLWWEPATDDGPDEWLRYVIYDAEMHRRHVQVGGATATGQALCSGQPDFWPLDAQFAGPTGRYYVRAVDLAGNEDGNLIARQTEACPAVVPDAGPTPDASATDAGAVGDADGDGGCGCHAGGTSERGAGRLWALLVALAFVWRGASGRRGGRRPGSAT